MGIVDPREADHVETCEVCEEQPVCDSHPRRCVLCHIQALLDDGEYSAAYDVATDEGISRMVVLNMVQTAAKWARMACLVNEMHTALRAMRPANDDASGRPCKTPPPCSDEHAVVALPANPVPTRFWNPDCATIRPGKVMS